jgi:CheY-like chemotaxis protein
MNLERLRPWVRPAGAQHKRALLIEDDPDIAASASLRLQAAGYATLIAGNAEDGLVDAAAELPDVIILDIRLPGMNGLSALKILRVDPRTRNIPVVALSASVVDRRSALDEGARFFLKKPYEGSEFVRAVEMAAGPGSPPTAVGVDPAGANPGDVCDAR